MSIVNDQNLQGDPDNMNAERIPRKTSSLLKKLEKAHQRKDIAQYINEVHKSIADTFVSTAVMLASSNDYMNMATLMEKITNVKLLSMTNENVITLVTCIMKMFKITVANSKYSYTFAIYLKGILRYLRRRNVKFTLNWQTLYQFYHINKNEVFFRKNETLSDLYKQLPFFINEAMTEDDYKLIRRDLLELIYHSNLNFDLTFISVFVSKKYFVKDIELQNVLLNAMSNALTPFKQICKILKLCFKDTNKKPEFDLKSFIPLFFTRVNQMLSGNELINRNDSGVTFHLAKDGKVTKRKKFKTGDVEEIIVGLLFSDVFEEYRSEIDEHFSQLMNSISLRIKEKLSAEKNAIMRFLNHFGYAIKKVFTRKDYSELTCSYKPLDYGKNKKLYERFNFIVENFFSEIIQKLFNFDVKKSNNFLSIIFDIMIISIQERNDINNILDLYFGIFKIFDNNIEICLKKFITKIDIFLPFVLSLETQNQDIIKRIQKFILISLETLVSNINSANPGFNVKIIKIFTKILLVLSNKIVSPVHVECLSTFFKQNSFTIIKQLVSILDLFAPKIEVFNNFVLQLYEFLDENASNEISKIFTTYIEENEIDSKYLGLYINQVLNHEELFNFCYNALIDVDNDNNYEKRSHCLYNDEQIKKIEVTVTNEKKLNYYMTILYHINFATFDFKKCRKKIITIIHGMINQKEYKFFKVAYFLLRNVSTLLNIDFGDEEGGIIIIYPSKETIHFVLDIWKEVVTPYEEEVSKASKLNEIEEHIFAIYLNFSDAILDDYLNIFINYSTDFPLKESPCLSKDLIEDYTAVNEYLIKLFKKVHDLSKMYESSIDHKEESVASIKISSISLIYEIISNHLSLLNILLPPYVKDTKDILHIIKSGINNFSNKINTSNIKVYLLSFKIIKTFKFATKVNEENLVGEINSIFSKFDTLYDVDYNKFALTIPGISEGAIKKLYHEIYDKFVKRINEMSKDTSSIIDQSIMSNIFANFYSISKFIILMNKFGSIEVVEKFISLLLILKEHNYKTIPTFLPKMWEIIFNLKHKYTAHQNDNDKFYKKNPDLLRMKNDDSFPVDDGYLLMQNKIEARIKEYTEYYISHRKEFDKKIRDFLKILLHSKSHATNGKDLGEDVYRLLFISCNLYILFSALDMNSDEDMKIYNEFEKDCFEHFQNNSISIDLRKIWFYNYLMITRNKVKRSKKYEVATYEESEYEKNMTEILKNSKAKLNLNTIPVKYIPKSLIDLSPKVKSTLTRKLTVKEVYDFNYSLNDFAYERTAMTGSKTKSFFLKSTKVADVPAFIEAIVTNSLGFKNIQESPINESVINGLYYLMHLDVIPSDVTEIFGYVDSKSNKIVSSVTKLSLTIASTLFALYKKDYNLITLLIEKIVSFYVDGMEKEINFAVMKSLLIILKQMSMTEFEIVFKKDDLLFKLNDSIMIVLVYELKKNYNSGIELLFNSPSDSEIKKKLLKKVHDLIYFSVTDVKNFLQNSEKIPTLMISYLILSSMIKSTEKIFLKDFTQDAYNVFKEIAEADIQNEKILYEKYSLILNYFPNALSANFEVFYMYLIGFCHYVSEETDAAKIGNVMAKYETTMKQIHISVDVITDVRKIINKMNTTFSTLTQKGKLLILQTIRLIYINNIHFINLVSNKENIMKLIEIFLDIESLIDDDNLKGEFSEIFIYFYNSISKEENKKIISVYTEKAENEYSSLCNKYLVNKSFHYFIASQLLRFRIILPDYIQNFIIVIGEKIKKSNDKKEIKILQNFISKAMDRYHSGFMYMKEKMSGSCCEVLIEASKNNNSYFV